MNIEKRIDDAEQIIGNHNGNMTNMSGMDSGTLTNSTTKASRRLMQPWICPAILLLSILVALLLTAPGALAQTQTCMDDLSPLDGLVCTANDVRVARYNVISGPPSCIAGEDITLVLQAELVSTASERYDTGFFVALDGGNALTGSCFRDYLPPPLSGGGTCSETGGTCLKDEDCLGGDTDVCVGGYDPDNGPFYNAEFSKDPGDTCGDLEQAVTTLRDLPEITIKCQDQDNDGIADVGTCVAWDNLKSAGTEKKPSCTGIDDTLPNTKSKCNCEAVQVGEIEVLGQIIVDKVTDPSGDPQSFDFSLTGGPNNVDVSFSLTDQDDPFESEGLKAGTYSVTESVPSGWELTSATCDDGSDPSAIDLAPGEIVTCTFNDKLLQGTLTLVKTVANDNGGSATADDFQAYIDGSQVAWGEVNTLIAGTYTASEDELPGYAASDWGGDCAADGTVTVEPGVNKTCTITNDDIAPTLTLVKTVVNDNGGTLLVSDFPLFVDGTPATSGMPVTLDAGAYTASETEQYGYAASGWGGDCAADGTVTLSVGDAKVCMITNDDIAPTLTLVKTVANDNGGTLLVSDFPLFVDGTPATSGMPVTLDAGAYTASETEQYGYAASDWGGDCAVDGTVTLSVGDAKVCMITNDDIAPTLTLVKTVVNDNGGTLLVSDFPLFVDGTPATSDVPVTLDAGAYTASETEQYGYAASDWGGDCAVDGTVTLSVGDAKVCMITNDDIAPTLTLVKTVVNDNGGTLLVSDFPLFVDGTPATSDVPVTLDAGAYTASETEQYGYAASDWGGDCAVDGTVTLSVGDAKVCMITNDDIAPTLTLVKTVVNDNGGTLLVSDFPLFVDGTPATSDVPVTLDAGAYTASETEQYGYAASDWGGDCAVDGTVTLSVGDAKVCMITNDDIAPTLTLVKTVVNDNGGTLLVSDFPLFVDGTPATSDVPVTLDAGAYTASETEQYGYAASDWGGNCAADGTVTLSVGDAKVCMITNDDIAPTLTLVKTVANDNGGTLLVSDFPLFVDGTPATSGMPVTLDAGAYTASETEQYGYAASGWGGDCAVDGTVTLSVGDAKVCMITNDDIAPTLTVIKHVINDDDGTLLAEHFDITVSGTAVADGSTTFPGEESPGTTLELNAGTFDVTETDAFAYFYTATFDGDCSGTLLVGDEKTCTITNDDNAMNLPSIEINSLSAALDETRSYISGEFDITDNSEGGNKPDGFLILLSHYDLDWEYKTIEGPYEPNDPNGPEGGSLTINGQTVTYTCTYNIVDIDGVAGNPAGYESGDQVIFDESLTIAYECQYEYPIPDTGTLRGTVTADIFGRPGRTFTFRQNFPL